MTGPGRNGAVDDAGTLADAYARGALGEPAAGDGTGGKRPKGGHSTGRAGAGAADSFDDVADEPGWRVLADVAAWLAEHSRTRRGITR